MCSDVIRREELKGKIYGDRKIETELEDLPDDKDKAHEAVSR